MAWLRIDDRVRTHPKIAQAGPAAAWLWFCGVCYCREHLTDGFIPESVVSSLAMNLTHPKRHAERLVAVGLWHRVDGGFAVHDFLDWNPSRSEVMSLRDKERDKKRKQRKCPEGTSTGHDVSVPVGHQGDASRARAIAYARDRAGDAGLGSFSGSIGVAVGGESREGESVVTVEPADETPPVWHASRRHRPLGANEAYHRRNCAPWAYPACLAGLCVPKYLWPQWEQRQPVDALRAFVERWAGRAKGDAAEKFWPAAFEAEFGRGAPTGDKASRTINATHRVLERFRQAAGDGQ